MACWQWHLFLLRLWQQPCLSTLGRVLSKLGSGKILQWGDLTILLFSAILSLSYHSVPSYHPEPSYHSVPSYHPVPSYHLIIQHRFTIQYHPSYHSVPSSRYSPWRLGHPPGFLWRNTGLGFKNTGKLPPAFCHQVCSVFSARFTLPVLFTLRYPCSHPAITPETSPAMMTFLTNLVSPVPVKRGYLVLGLTVSQTGLIL